MSKTWYLCPAEAISYVDEENQQSNPCCCDYSDANGGCC